MKLNGFLLLTEDNKRARLFYESLFNLKMIKDYDGNMLLEGGIYLQERKYWEKFINNKIITNNNASELHFIEDNIEDFVSKLERLYPNIKYVNKLFTHEWGQKVVRFYDLDGNLIEVGTSF
ncbi:MAG: VOC family protein [Bacillales bacterium]|nr:VOC family protein [Bacillales bacterium]